MELKKGDKLCIADDGTLAPTPSGGEWSEKDLSDLYDLGVSQGQSGPDRPYPDYENPGAVAYCRGYRAGRTLRVSREEVVRALIRWQSRKGEVE